MNRYEIPTARDLYSALGNAPSDGTRIETSDGRSLRLSEASRKAMRLAEEVEAGTLLLTLVTTWAGDLG